MSHRRLTGILRFADFAGSDRAVEILANDFSRELSHA